MSEILSYRDFHSVKIIKKIESKEHTYFVKLIIYLMKPDISDKIKLIITIDNRINYRAFLVDFREHSFENNYEYISSVFEIKNENCDICQKEESKIENNLCVSCEIELIFKEVERYLIDDINVISEFQKAGFNISLTDEKEYGPEL